MNDNLKNKKISITDLRKSKNSGEKISMLTAYDYPTALLLDKAGIEIILVGDSVGNVVLGYENTLPVTMDEMLHHVKAVKKGITRAFLVADMPFMSFHITPEETVRNAGRFIKESAADAVKIEGASASVLSMIKAVIASGIAVMGHIGLTPQTATMLGGYKVQGRTRQAAKSLLAQAKALESAGVFSIVMECVPDELAALITGRINIPTIGIGAGSGCDGQVLVCHDMLGLTPRFVPKFVKQYARVAEQIEKAARDYIHDVKQKKFPAAEHGFKIDKKELKGL